MAGSITILSTEPKQIETVIQDLALVSFQMGSTFRIEKGRYEKDVLQSIMVFFQKNYKEEEDQFIDFSVFPINFQYVEDEWNVVAKSSHLDERIALEFSYRYLNLRGQDRLSFISGKRFEFGEIEKFYSQPFRDDWFCQEA